MQLPSLRILLTALLSSGLLAAEPKTLYVSPGGSDANDGLTAGSPVRTVNHGISLAAAGDTVYLLPGTYRELISIVQKKGAAERPLCILGYGGTGGVLPVIDGGASAPAINNTTNAWMIIATSDWIRIGGIEFRNGWTDPIHLLNSSYLTFDGCRFSGGRKVIAASGTGTHHVLVQNCTWDQGGAYLWKLVTDPAGADAWTSMHEGLLQYYNGTLVDMSGTGGSFVIRNNTISNAFNGIRWSAKIGYDGNVEIYDNTVSNIRDNDFEPEYYTYNLHIYHNRSHNIHKTMSVDHVRGGCIYYYGNVITSDTDSWSDQICTSFWKVYGAGADNLTAPLYVFNNSFCGNGKVFPMDAGTIASQLKHYNNAYYLTGSRSWVLDAVDSTDLFDYDLSNKSWPANIAGRSQERHGLIADVQYADARGFDLHLKPTSPAIDGGTALALPEFGWTQGYLGSAPDIGAYEGEDLQEGPPFRFRTIPGMAVTYTEKPRIVRSRLSGGTLSLYFSAALDPATVSRAGVTVTGNGSAAGVTGVGMAEENFRMDISLAAGGLTGAPDLAVRFDPLPRGVNGESVTLWGAALPSYRRSIVTSAAAAPLRHAGAEKLDVTVYPNPLRPQGHIAFRIPAALAGGGGGVIRIYDVLGRQVKEQRFSPLREGAALSVDVAQLSAGTYFGVLQSGGKTAAHKFIILK